MAMSHTTGGGGPHTARGTPTVSTTPSPLLLHQACMDGDMAAVKRLIQSGEVVNACDNAGNLPLHLSIASNRHNVTQLLLFPEKEGLFRRQADRADPYDAPPPAYEQVQQTRGDARIQSPGFVNINATNSAGLSALALAVSHCNLKSVEQLMEAGADPNLGWGKGPLPLHIAVQRQGYHALLIQKHLLQHGASAIFTDDKKRTSFLVACEHGNLQAVRAFLEVKSTPHGPRVYTCSDMADENHRCHGTVLHCAARSGNGSLVEFLVSKGARIEKCDSQKAPAVFEAFSAMNFHCVRSLLKVDRNDPDGFQFITQSILRMECPEAYLVKVVKAIFVHSRNYILSRDSLQRTPLHLCVSAGSLKLAEMLLEARAPVNAVNYKGDTPLHGAVYGYLKTNMAAMTKANKKRSDALDIDSSELHDRMVALLLHYKADVSLASADGLSVLHMCMEWNDEKVGKLLVDAGARSDTCSLCLESKPTPTRFCPEDSDRDVMSHSTTKPRNETCCDFISRLTQ